MKQPQELRRHIRHPGQTLVIEVDGFIHPLIDISIGGLCFEGEGYEKGQRIAVKISSALDADDAIETMCDVAYVSGPRIGARFAHITFPLLRYVVCHIAAVTGTAPYMLRKRGRLTGP